MLKMAREDLLHLRRLLAEKHGRELTPDEVLAILRKARRVEIIDEPGLVTDIKRRRNGDSSTS